MFFRPKKPIPHKDATWLANCYACDNASSFVSYNGFRNGGVEHCYQCGNKRETTGFKQSDIDRMIISSWCHWQKYPIIPYNWHQLSEKNRWEILGIYNE